MAQDFGSVEDRRTNATTYIYFVMPGEATMQVYVWGTVRQPGLYEVRNGATLDELLSLAGGPLATPTQDRDRREVVVRVYRPSGEGRSLVYEAMLEDSVREPQNHPRLQSEDVVEVDMRIIRPFGLRETMSVVGGLGGVIAIILQVVALSTR